MAHVLTLEFTIEPFVEGQPGPHVLEAVAAAEALGAIVEFGPFGSACVVPAARAGEFAQAVITAAFANGATHVSMSAQRTSDVEPDAGVASGVTAGEGVDEWADRAEPS
jgi:hypothetical protein